MRYLSAVFLVLVLMTGSVWAQDSPVFNRLEPRMPDFLENTRGEGIPDTTEPWRYFPLEVGNTWEYLTMQGHIYRRYVEKDTLVNGYEFFIVNSRFFEPDGQPIWDLVRLSMRFDTLTSRVLALAIDGHHSPFYFECPFDLPFGITAYCNGKKMTTGGGYDRLLVFPKSGEPPDSIYTTIKIMDNNYAEEFRFAADFGEIYYWCHECSNWGWGLQAARLGGWDGQVYGELRFPPPITSNEEGFSTSVENNLAAWPNPFQNDLNISFRLAQASRTNIEVIDLLGRIVEYEDLGFRMHGEHTVTLHLPNLPTGAYALRLMLDNGRVVVRRITRVN